LRWVTWRGSRSGWPPRTNGRLGAGGLFQLAIVRRSRRRRQRQRRRAATRKGPASAVGIGFVNGPVMWPRISSGFPTLRGGTGRAPELAASFLFPGGARRQNWLRRPRRGGRRGRREPLRHRTHRPARVWGTKAGAQVSTPRTAPPPARRCYRKGSVRVRGGIRRHWTTPFGTGLEGPTPPGLRSKGRAETARRKKRMHAVGPQSCSGRTGWIGRAELRLWQRRRTGRVPQRDRRCRRAKRDRGLHHQSRFGPAGTTWR